MPIALPDFVAGSAGRDRDRAQRHRRSSPPISSAAGCSRRSIRRRSSKRSPIPTRCRASPTGASINAQALVTGRITRQGDGRLKAEFRLWDVFAGQQLAGKQYFTTPDNWRRIAHIISDAIYETLTGEKGYFDSRIVFVDETGPKERRVKRLAIMDQDGANVRYLTRGDDLVLTPRFKPTTQEITYMSYGQGDPRVYLLNIETGQREIVGNFPGMTFAPRFSPDGQRVIMSLQQGANANLFVMDLRSKATTRLTDTPAIDTAPCYSPDGTRICFESDRGGTQQIYVMAANGGPAQRISFGEGHHSTPVWSPRGDYIAFTGQARGQFRDRHHQAGRLGRAHPHRRLPQRRPDLRAERAGADVLPRSRQRPVAFHDRHHRPQRAQGSDAELCLGSGLVAAVVLTHDRRKVRMIRCFGAGSRAPNKRHIFTGS